MGYLLILINQAAHQVEGMLVRRYGKKHGAGGLFFNAIICLFAMLFFVLTDKGGFYFPKELWLYGFVSCLMFAAGFYSMYLALQLGSYAISRLISSFSGVFAIVYGLVFLKEPAGVMTYIAFILVFASVFLMNYKTGGKEDGEEKGFSVKWLICVLVALVSNGMIAVLSRMQQLRFENACDNEFMMLSLGGAFAALMLIGLVTERGKLKQILKYGMLYGGIAGLMNGAANLVNLATYLFLPISVVTPIRTGLGIVTNFVISVLVYKEKFTRRQLVSAVIGVLALVLLKLGQ
ncbi:MAG: DMT family transporter [Clostridia bacterium]|nr:DMT family transporter [Clostridia bacterium]